MFAANKPNNNQRPPHEFCLMGKRWQMLIINQRAGSSCFHKVPMAPSRGCKRFYIKYNCVYFGFPVVFVFFRVIYTRAWGIPLPWIEVRTICIRLPLPHSLPLPMKTFMTILQLILPSKEGKTMQMRRYKITICTSGTRNTSGVSLTDSKCRTKFEFWTRRENSFNQRLEKDGSQWRVIVYLLDVSEADDNEHLADLNEKPHSSPTPPPLLFSSFYPQV